MCRLSLLAVLVLTAAIAAQPASSSPPDILRLVKQLGSEEYAEREAASKRLGSLGAAALPELRAATRSENPEVVRRARELVRKIEHRNGNEKTLAPTLVTLDAKNERLDDVLAELSKQAKFDVVLNGPQFQELADRRITVSTRGEAPFWDAVVRVCDSADLSVAGAGGFSPSSSTTLPPDAVSLPRSSALPRVRTARDANRAVVLGPRGSSPRRSAGVYGAVLVEAIPIPAGTGPAHAVLLQVWPEPRLAWGAASGVKIGAAIDDAGERLAAEGVSLAIPKVRASRRGGLVVVRRPDGGAAFVEEGSDYVPVGLRPNARQAVVLFKAGENSPTVLKQLDLAVLGTVRTEVEPLSRAAGLEENRQATGVGVDGIEFSVRYHKNRDGRFAANVTVAYDRQSVVPVGVDVELPFAKGAGPGRANYTVQGVRITDAEDKPYSLGVIGGSSRPDRGRQTMTLTLELHPDKDGHGPPAVATFWGTYAKPVEVPVVLRDVPLSSGK